MQIEEYNPNKLNLTEFLKLYDIDMILNNELINKSYFELYNREQLYNNFYSEVMEAPEYYIYHMEEIDPDDLEKEIDNYILENYDLIDVYQYYIVIDYDVERYLLKYLPGYPIFYSEELELYLLGIPHYGMSWSFFFTEAPRPEHMKIKEYEKILNNAAPEAAK